VSVRQRRRRQDDDVDHDAFAVPFTSGDNSVLVFRSLSLILILSLPVVFVSLDCLRKTRQLEVDGEPSIVMPPSENVFVTLTFDPVTFPMSSVSCEADSNYL